MGESSIKHTIMANPSSPTTTSFCILSGNCEYKLDAQHRVAIPAEWRSESPTGCFVLIPGRDHTLQLYTEAVYMERVASKLNALSPSNKDDLVKLRQLGARTFKLQCDKQGRIQIPQILINFAQLGDTVAFVSSCNFGQILDGARWEREFKEFDDGSDGFLDVLD